MATYSQSIARIIWGAIEELVAEQSNGQAVGKQLFGHLEVDIHREGHPVKGKVTGRIVAYQVTQVYVVGILVLPIVHFAIGIHILHRIIAGLSRAAHGKPQALRRH